MTQQRKRKGRKMKMHKVTVNYRTIYRGTRAECDEVARRERQSWGPLYLVRVERI